MTNEQREAIRQCELYVQAEATIQLVDEIDGKLAFKSCDTSAIDTVLSLIKEQSAELLQKNAEIEKKDKIIDFYKKGLEREIESNRENILEIIKQDREIKKLEKQSKNLDKQAQQYFEKTIYLNKQIDLMAEEIANSIINTCPLADYDFDLDCENRCNDNTKECWKIYFERKAENEK